MSLHRIALDVMGGDNAPEAILEGALMATAPQGTWKLPTERLKLNETGRGAGFPQSKRTSRSSL